MWLMKSKESFKKMLLITSMVLQILAMSWVFFTVILPTFPKIAAQLKIALTVLFLAIPYYFSAIIAFMLQKPGEDRKDGDVTIAGRTFKVDLNLFNATNHIIVSTGLIFAGLALLAASRM